MIFGRIMFEGFPPLFVPVIVGPPVGPLVRPMTVLPPEDMVRGPSTKSEEKIRPCVIWYFKTFTKVSIPMLSILVDHNESRYAKAESVGANIVAIDELSRLSRLLSLVESFVARAMALASESSPFNKIASSILVAGVYNTPLIL